MTKLDELKTSLQYDRNSDGSWPREYGYELRHKTLDTLIQIAEAAFEISVPMNADGYCQCSQIKGSHYDHPSCPWKRIQDLKKALEEA